MLALLALRTGVLPPRHRSASPLLPAIFAALPMTIRKSTAVLILGCLCGWALVTVSVQAAVAAELGSVVHFAGPAGAELVIDNQNIGTFPLTGPLTLAPGVYRLEATLPGYRPFETELTITDAAGAERFMRIRLDPYRRSHAWTSNILFAGLGQHYLNKSVKGYFFNLVEATGLVAALVGQAQYSNFKEDYLLLKDNYDTAINSDDIAEYKEAADEAYSQMEDSEKLRNAGLLIAASAIVVSIIDVLIFFPDVEAGPGPAPPVVGHGAPDLPWPKENPWHTVHAGLVLKF